MKQFVFGFCGLFLVAFLSLGCVDAAKVTQLENEVGRLNQVIQEKDAQISTLTEEAQAKNQEFDNIMKELETVRGELEATRGELEGVKKLLEGAKQMMDKPKPAPEAPQQ